MNATIEKVIDAGIGNRIAYGLYLLTSGQWAMGPAGLSTGDVSHDLVFLRSKSGSYPLADARSLLVDNSDRFNVISYADGIWSTQSFDATGLARGWPQTLTLGDVVALEQRHGRDIDGQYGFYGEITAIPEVATSPGATMRLYATSSGTWIVAASGLNVGDVPERIFESNAQSENTNAAQLLALKKGTQNHELVSPKALIFSPQGFSVVARDDANWSAQAFDLQGQTRGRPTWLSTDELLALEERHAIDINQDGRVHESNPAPTLTEPSTPPRIEIQHPIELQFSEAVQLAEAPADDTVRLIRYNPAAADTVVEVFRLTDGTGSEGGRIGLDPSDGRTLVITPGQHLAGEQSYAIEFRSNLLVDKAGRALAHDTSLVAYHFEAVDPDPSLLSSTPVHGGWHSTTADIVLQFSEPVRLGTGAIRLLDGNGQLVEAFEAASAKGLAGGQIAIGNDDLLDSLSSLVRIDPGRALLAGQTYQLEVDSGALLDGSGQPFAGIGTGHAEVPTLSFKAMQTAPQLVSTSPARNAFIDAQDTIQLQFDGEIKVGQGSVHVFNAKGEKLTRFDVQTGLLQGRISIDGDRVTLQPSSALKEGRGHYILIDQGAFVSASGLPYAGIYDRSVLPFSVTDLPPLLTKSTPAQGGTMDADANLMLTFSERVTAGTGAVTLIDKTNANATVESFDILSLQGTQNGRLSWGKSGDRITIDPGQDLLEGHEYVLQIAAGALKDNTGQAFTGMQGQTALNFSVRDMPPMLASSSPTDDGALIFDESLTLTFNEPVQPGTGAIRIRRADNDAIVAAFDMADAHTALSVMNTVGPLNFVGQQVHLKPGTPLTPGVRYYVQIDGNAVKDEAGQTYAGINSQTALNFLAIDPLPALIGTSPNHGGMVNPGSALTLQFSEPVFAGPGFVRLVHSHDQALIESFDPQTGMGSQGGQLYIQGSNVRVNPGQKLTKDTSYHLSIAANALRDSSGQHFPGLEGNTAFKFSVIDPPPQLLQSTPRDNGQHDIQTNLSLVFTKPMRAGEGSIGLYKTGTGLVESFDLSTGLGSQGGSIALGGLYAGMHGSDTVTINPAADLVANSAYHLLIDSQALEDTTGQPFAGISSSRILSFTAINPPPVLTNSYPRDDGNIIVGQRLSLHFSETIQAGKGIIRLHAKNGTLLESFDVQTLVGSKGGTLEFAVLSAIFIAPGSPLIAGAEYYLTLDEGALVDTSGQSYAGIASPSMLNFTAIDPLPTLLFSSPFDEGTIDVDGNISLNFSEAVKAGSGTVKLYRSNGTLVESFNVSTGQGNSGGSLSFGKYGQSVTIDPGVDLIKNSAYYLTIDPTAIEDSTGQKFAGIQNASTLNFTAVDPSPTLSYSSPSDEGTMEVDETISLNFSEAVKAGSGTFKLFRGNGTEVESFNVSNGKGSSGGSLSFGKNGQSVTIDPGADLIKNSAYYLTIDPTAIEDSTGQKFAGIQNATTLNFTAVNTAPQLSGSSPSNNGTLQAEQDLMLWFTEPVYAGQGLVRLHRSSDGAVVESFNVQTLAGSADGQMSISGNQVYINPSVNLTKDAAYYITVDAGALVDQFNESFAGISDYNPLRFRAIDPAPTLSYSSPGDNGTIEVDGNISLNFSEAVKAGTGTVKLYRSNGTEVESFNVSTGQGSSGGSLSFGKYGQSVTVEPGVDLIKNSGYYLTIDPTSIEDSTGQKFAGIQNATTLNFTAVNSLPTLSNSSPFDEGTMEVDGTISLNFSEAVKAGTGTVKLYHSNGTEVESFNVSTGQGSRGGNLGFSKYGHSVTVDPGADLIKNSAYYLTIDPTAIEDSTGQKFAGIQNTTTLNFTAVNTAPQLYGSSPSNNSTHLAEQDLTLWFSEPLSAGQGLVRLHRSSDGAVVESFDVQTLAGSAGGQISISGNSLYINPAVNLTKDAAYYITVDAGALVDRFSEGFAGIIGNNQLRFTAVDPLPTLSFSSPVDNGTLEVDSDISFTFSETVKAGTGTIKLLLGNGSVVETFDITTGRGTSGGTLSLGFGKNGNAVSLNPGADLVKNSTYYLTIDPTAIEDSTGQKFAGIQNATTLNFTAVNTAPQLSSSWPYDNGTHQVEQDLMLWFTEPVYAGQGLVRLHRSSDGAVVESFDIQTLAGSAGGQLSIWNSAVSINPAVNLTKDAAYYITVEPGTLVDRFDEDFAGIGANNPLRFTAVDPVPTLSYTSPADNGTMEIDGNISLNFSEAVKAGTGTVKLYHSNGTEVESFNVSTGQGSSGGSLSFGKYGQSVTIDPGVDLIENSDYYLRIDPSAIEDQSGQKFAGIQDATTLNFKAINNPPTLQSSYPANGDSVDLRYGISLNFSESIRQGTGFIRLHRDDGAEVERWDINGSVSVFSSSLWFSPTTRLAKDTTYYLTVDSTAIVDRTNKAFAGISDPLALRFTMLDPAPSLNGSYPPLGTSLEVQDGVQVYFSEAIFAGSGQVRWVRSVTQEVVETFDANTGLGSNGGLLQLQGSSLYLDFGAAPLAGVRYHLVIDPAAIKDDSGQYFPGAADDQSLSFQVVDSPPKLNYSIPAQGDTHEVQNEIHFGFSEAITPGTGFVRLTQSNGALVETFDVATGVGSQGGLLKMAFDDQIHIKLGLFLTGGQTYQVSIDDTAFTDASGQFYTELNALSFSAVNSPPTLTYTRPYLGNTLELHESISLSFSEPVVAGPGAVVLRKEDGTLVERFDLMTQRGSEGGTVYLGVTNITVQPESRLVDGVRYSVTVTENAIKDRTGQAFTELLDPARLSFVASDTPPSVRYWSFPKQLEIEGTLSLNFTEPVTAAGGLIRLLQEGQDTPLETFSGMGTLGSAGGQLTHYESSIFIRPGITLVAGQRYALVLDPDAYQDESGQDLVGVDGVRWSFDVRDSVPSLTYSDPSDNGEKRHTDNLYLNFSENVLPGTGFVRLYRLIDDAEVEVFNVETLQGSQGGTLEIQGNRVGLNPVDDLTPGTAYYITVDSTALKDHSGQHFAGLTKANAIDFTAVNPRPNLTHTNINSLGQFEYQSDLALNFSEKVLAGPGSIQLKTSSGQLLETFSLANLTGDQGGSVAFSFSSVHINPFADLTPGQSYVFSIDANSLQDDSGQFFTGPTTLPLTAINEPPRLTYSSPPDDGFPEPMRALYLSFTEAIQAGTGEIRVFKVGNGGIDALVESFDVATASNDYSSPQRIVVGSIYQVNALELYLAQPLEAGYTYYVLIDPTAITDRSGLPFAGLSSPTALDFHVIDSPPALSWSAPGRFGTMSPQDDLRLYFTENVQAGTGRFMLSSHDGTVVETFDIGGTTGSAGGSLQLWDYSLTLNPGQDLVPGQRYTLSQEPGTLFDSAQQPMVDLVGVNALSFSVTE